MDTCELGIHVCVCMLAFLSTMALDVLVHSSIQNPHPLEEICINYYQCGPYCIAQMLCRLERASKVPVVLLFQKGVPYFNLIVSNRGAKEGKRVLLGPDRPKICSRFREILKT